MRYLFICLHFCLLCSCHRKYDYDVIIVGGGLAGLSAAKELNADNVLILEKDSLLGGRVRTANFENKYYYDLGAVFALDSNYRAKILLNDKEILQQENIGFWINGKLFQGKNVVECLLQIPGTDTAQIRSLSEQKTLDSKKLDSTLMALLNINIKAVFPAAIYNYNINVQPYAWVRYNSSHFEHGNQNVTDYFIKDKKFNCRLNSYVTSVTDHNDHVEVIYFNNGKPDTLTAKKVIVATTATVANKLIARKSEYSSTFLNGVSYAGYYSIAVGTLRPAGQPDVAYLMPLNTGFSSILKQRTLDNNMTIFQLYIAEEDFYRFKDSVAIRTGAIKVLKDIWKLQETDISFYQSYFWKEAGVVVNDHYLKKWEKSCLQPSANVILAGDYCSFEYGMPYGMIPAIVSGKNAAELIKNGP